MRGVCNNVDVKGREELIRICKHDLIQFNSQSNKI